MSLFLEFCDTFSGHVVDGDRSGRDRPGWFTTVSRVSVRRCDRDSQRAAEGLVQEGFLQGVQRGKLLLVEACKAVDFFGEGVESIRKCFLLAERRQAHRQFRKL